MSSNQKRQLILCVSIGVLAVWAGFTYWPPRSSHAATSNPTDTLPPVNLNLEASRAAAQTLTQPRIHSTFIAGPWPADPFFTPTASPATNDSANNDITTATPTRGYHLTAILAGDQPLALINGHLVRVGDQLPDGTTIIEINSQQVSLRDQAGTRVLKLPD